MSDSDDEQPPAVRQPEVDDPNAGLPSLFWDTVPEKPEDHPDWAALEALKEESTPRERAENFKAKNKVVLREAVEFYGKGLAEKSEDPCLDAILLCNRAHVHGLLGNWRNALEDAQQAQTLDPSNVKAWFRGAKAALQLGRHELCMQQCASGQALNPTAPASEFEALSKEAKAALDRITAETERKRLAEEKRLAPVRALANAIEGRKYQITLPQVRVDNSWRPSLEAGTGSLSWPVVILYPEGGTQDQLQAWEETDTVAAQLDQMFGPEAPTLDWDSNGVYTRDTVELYYLSHAGKPLNSAQLLSALDTGHWPELADPDGSQPGGTQGVGRQQWVRVKETWTLHDLLRQADFIIPGIPLLAAVAKGTEYRSQFLARNQ